MVVTFAVTTFCTALVYFWESSHAEDDIKKRYWLLLTLTVGIAYAFIMGVVGYFATIVFSLSFREMTFDILSTPLLLASFGSLVSYYVSESVVRFDRKKFAYIIFIEYIFGFLLAAMKTGDPDWWRESICSLGMPINGAPIYFNYTMIMTGILLWTFYIYLRPTIKQLISKGYLNKTQLMLVRIFYFSAGAMSLALGLLPFGVNETINQIHNLFGYGIYEFFGVFMIFAGFILKKFPKKFLIANYTLLFLGLSIFSSHMLFEYLTHGIMELFLALVLVSWLVIFVRTITTMSENTLK